MDYPFDTLPPGLYGLMGPAGSGKSSLADQLKSTYGFKIISLDDFFIGDSEYRKRLLKAKQERSIDALQDAVNQFNWWDWDEISRALTYMAPAKPVFVEGAILGPPSLLELYRKIFVYSEDQETRLRRLLTRDGHKRTVTQICARFLITEYSESLYYKTIAPILADKGVILKYGYDDQKVQFIPLEVS